MADLLEVSEIRITPAIRENSLLAFASCVINKTFHIGNIAVHKRRDGSLRLVFPSKRLSSGRAIDCFYPITTAANIQITDAISQAYFEYLLKDLKQAGYYHAS